MESPKFSSNAGGEPNILAKPSDLATFIVPNKVMRPPVVSLVSPFDLGNVRFGELVFSLKCEAL